MVHVEAIEMALALLAFVSAPVVLCCALGAVEGIAAAIRGR